MSHLKNRAQARQTLQQLTAKVCTAWLSSLLRPILGFRLTYLPLLMVYFAYGALGLIDVTRVMWIKERLTLNPAELAGIDVWLNLPWTVKMVFGQLVEKRRMSRSPEPSSSFGSSPYVTPRLSFCDTDQLRFAD